MEHELVRSTQRCNEGAHKEDVVLCCVGGMCGWSCGEEEGEGVSY